MQAPLQGGPLLDACWTCRKTGRHMAFSEDRVPRTCHHSTLHV
jgi:hypothetical protein